MVRFSPGVRTKSTVETVSSYCLGIFGWGFWKTGLNRDFRAKGALSSQRYGGARRPPGGLGIDGKGLVEDIGWTCFQSTSSCLGGRAYLDGAEGHWKEKRPEDVK